MKYSSCIDMMFADLPFEKRFKAAADCGLNAVEFWKWSNKNLDFVCKELKNNGLQFSVFNIDSQNEQLSYDLSRGILNAGRVEEFMAALKESIPVYKKLNAAGMIVLIGETIKDLSKEAQNANILKCLKAAAPLAEENGVTLVVESLNSFDRENYYMPYTADLFKILNEVNSPAVKMLYDIYHQHKMGDFSLAEIDRNLARIGHFHVADCPGRHEPGTGTANYVAILKHLKALNYGGYIGLEYRATKPDSQTLNFINEVENK